MESSEESKKVILSEERDQVLLQFFWDLASVEEDQRKIAVTQLLKYLIEKQKSWEKQNPQDKECLQLKYSIKRLSKGLSSSREGARQGFATALTEILRIFPFIDTKDVFTAILQEKVTGSMKKQEAKDIYFGHLFGCITLLRSGRVFSDSNQSLLSEIIQTLLNLSSKKAFLKDPCYEAICLAADQVSKESFQKHIFPHIQPLLSVKSKEFTPEMLSLALHFHNKFSIPFREIAPRWKRDLLHNKSLSKLSEILKETSSTHPKLHGIWKHFIQLFSNPSNDIQNFWKFVVDESLFVSSNERKYLGFILFEKFLPILSLAQVSFLFTPNFMNCFIYELSHSESFLHAQSKHVLKTIIQLVNERSELAMPIVMQLIGSHGSQNFDSITKTKTIETLLSQLDSKSFVEFLHYLEDSFLDQSSLLEKYPEDGITLVENHRLWILNQMYSLIKHRSLPREEEWAKEILQFFMFHGFFSHSDQAKKNLQEKVWSPPHPEITYSTKRVCKERFFSLLKDLNDFPSFNKEAPKAFHGTTSNNQFWTYFISGYQRNLRKAKYAEKINLSESILERRERVYELNDFIEKNVKKLEPSTEDIQKLAFQLLLSSVELQLYFEEDIEEIDQVLGELLECYHHSFLEEKKQPKFSKVEGEDLPEPIEVLTDVLMSLLSKPSNLLRTTVERAFRIFCSQLTPKALDIILQVINDVQEIPENGEEDDEMDIEENESKETSNEESDESSSEEETSNLDEESENSTQEEEENIITDDDEMIKYDEKLAEMFKHLKNRKASKQDLERKTIHFKFKVLDLVEIIIRKLETNPLIFNLVLPLIESLKVQQELPEAKSLVEKIASLLTKKLFKIKNYPTNLTKENVQFLHEILETLWEILKNLPQEKQKKNTLSSIAANGIHFVCRVLIGNKSKDTSIHGCLNSEIHINHFRKLLHTNYTTRLLNLNPQFFPDFVSRQPWIGWATLQEILVGVTQGRNEYLKCEPFRIVQAFVKADKANWSKEKFQQLLPLFQKSFQDIFKNLPKLHSKRATEILVNTNTVFAAAKSVGIDVTSNDMKSFIETNLMNSALFQSNSLKNRLTTLFRMVGGIESELKRKKETISNQPKKEEQENESDEEENKEKNSPQKNKPLKVPTKLQKKNYQQQQNGNKRKREEFSNSKLQQPNKKQKKIKQK